MLSSLYLVVVCFGSFTRASSRSVEGSLKGVSFVGFFWQKWCGNFVYVLMPCVGYSCFSVLDAARLSSGSCQWRNARALVQG